MNKTFWIGYVVVFVVAQLINFLVHGLLLDSTYKSLGAVFRPEEQMMNMMWIMFLGAAVMLLLFCYIFTKGYENRGIPEGIRYGTLVGVFFFVPYALDQYVVYPITPYLTHMWLITGILTFAILGGVFSAIYKPRI